MGRLANEVPVSGRGSGETSGTLDKLLMRLVPREALHDDVRVRSRALLLLRFTLVAAAFTAVFCPYFAFYLDIPYTVSTNLLYALSLAATPLVLRKTRSVTLACHWALFWAFAVLLFQVVMLGGTSSLTFPWLVVLPIAGMLLCGTRGGFIWTLVSIAAIASIGVADARAWLPASSLEYKDSASVVAWSVASLTLALGSLGWLFETRAGLLLRHLDRQRQTYRDLSVRDVLTGLANRAMISECIIQSWERCRRHGQRGALFFIDLNHFKLINDQHGHVAGDQVLREVAVRLKEALRRSDVAGRMGGDEFALVIDGIEDRNDAAALADKVASAIEAPMELDSGPVRVGASIGIAMYPASSYDILGAPADSRREPTGVHEKIGHESVQKLIQHADQAMYVAKREGHRYWLYGDDKRVARMPRETA